MSTRRTALFSRRTLALLGFVGLLVLPFTLLVGATGQSDDSGGPIGHGKGKPTGRTVLGPPGSHPLRDISPEGLAAEIRWMNKPQNKRELYSRAEWWPYANNQ